jgi:hypothetical protein
LFRVSKILPHAVIFTVFNLAPWTFLWICGLYKINYYYYYHYYLFQFLCCFYHRAPTKDKFFFFLHCIENGNEDLLNWIIE